MTALTRVVRRNCHRLLSLAVRGRRTYGTDWGEALLREFAETTGTWEALSWTAGGIRTVWRERRHRRSIRRRAAPLPVRVTRRLVTTVAMTAVAGTVVNQFVLTVRYIPSVTMEPTIMATDRVLVDRLSHHWLDLRHGELIMLRRDGDAPTDSFTAPFRLIGLPGDRIECAGGRVLRNGSVLDEPYLPAGSVTDCDPLTVPAATVYALGDARANARDSREWGPVPEDRVVGRILGRA